MSHVKYNIAMRLTLPPRVGMRCCMIYLVKLDTQWKCMVFVCILLHFQVCSFSTQERFERQF